VSARTLARTSADVYGQVMADATSHWRSLNIGGDLVANFKLQEREGRFVVTDLYLHGDEITAATLRAIPIRQVEAQANTPAGAYLSRLRIQREDDPTLEELRAGFALEREAKQQRRRKRREPLSRPDRTDPDAFYRQVAAAYSDVAGETRKVAKVLADEAGVPVTTVHRWVLEARRRGYLPPARRGRAG